MKRFDAITLLIGSTALGMLAGAGIAAHVCAKKAQRHEEEISRQFAAIAQQNAENQRKYDQLMNCTPDGFTMLYEPEDNATIQPSDILALVNSARPGLGTVLSKVPPNLEQKPSDRPGEWEQLRWVLHGHVRPVAIPPNFHAVYAQVPPAESQVQ